MDAAEKPQSEADKVEWMLLMDGYSQVSRGDVRVDRAFEVDPAEGSTTLAAANDSIAQQSDTDKILDDCFSHLEYRAVVFKGCYGLRIDKELVVRVGADGEESDGALVYRFLLACSQRDLSHSLAPKFSELCKLAFARFLGSCATVWNVDAGSSDRTRMGTNTREVAKYLEKFLGAKLLEDRIPDLPERAGDGGVDIVAAIGFSDDADGHLTFLGQCAASSSTEYWRDKIHQPDRFKKAFYWIPEPLLVTFIPGVYRKSTGAWINSINLNDSLFFDRLRILRSLNLEKDPLPTSLRNSLRAAIATAVAAASKRARSKPRKATKAKPAKRPTRAIAKAAS